MSKMLYMHIWALCSEELGWACDVTYLLLLTPHLVGDEYSTKIAEAFSAVSPNVCFFFLLLIREANSNQNSCCDNFTVTTFMHEFV